MSRKVGQEKLKRHDNITSLCFRIVFQITRGDIFGLLSHCATMRLREKKGSEVTKFTQIIQIRTEC